MYSLLHQDKTKARRIELLVANVDKQSQETILKYAEMSQAMLLYLEPSLTPSIQDLLELFCKATTNSIGLSDTFFEYAGYAVSLDSCLMNHACVPNATAYFVGNKLSVRTIRGCEEGEELTLSYLDGLDIEQARKDHLSRDYAFKCDCSACIDMHDELLDAFKCPEPGCFGIIARIAVPTPVCSKCGPLTTKHATSLRSETDAHKKVVSLIDPATDSNDIILHLLNKTKSIAPIQNLLHRVLLMHLIESSKHAPVHSLSTHYEQLIAHLESHFSNRAPNLMKPYIGLAEEYAKSRFTMARSIEFYEKALAVIDVTLGIDHPYRVVVKANLIEVVGEHARLNT